MEILKRIINLVYALLMMGGLTAIFVNLTEMNWENLGYSLQVIGAISLVFGVINFSLFKKFTFWNR